LALMNDIGISFSDLKGGGFLETYV
jgi:hypothetical protein